MTRTLVVHIEVPAEHVGQLTDTDGLAYTEEALIMAVTDLLGVALDFNHFNASVRGELNGDGTVSQIA